MTVSNITKSATVTMANAVKHLSTFGRYIKGGSGWRYDEAGFTYDGAADPISGNQVLYDGVGTLPIWSNATKHTA